MVVTILVIALIVLWLTGVFGPPVIPEIVLPTITIAWSDPFIQAILIVALIIVVVSVVRR